MSLITPAIGIDFGTSNSKMAWYNPKTNQAEILRNAEGEEQTPSVVYFGESETLVGSPAEAMLEYEQERERIIISIKRELATTPVIALPGRLVKPVEVAAEILHKLKRDAEEQHFLQEITRAIITCPASFGPLDRDKIREAAQLAGFGEVELLGEPIAAAIAYTQMGLQVGKYVLVYDLGGGTFDLAVLAREDDGLFHPALEPQGIKRCGGDDFDEALYNYCDRIAREKLGRPVSLTGKRDLHFLSECRQRKENLSSSERRMFKSLLEPGAVLFQQEIDRVTFEHLISATVEETVRKTVALLEQANAEGYGVDTVVLVGGSTRVPLTQRLLNESLPLKSIPWQHRDVAVAFGAAYHAQNKWGGLGAEKTPVALDRRVAEEKHVHTIEEYPSSQARVRKAGGQPKSTIPSQKVKGQLDPFIAAEKTKEQWLNEGHARWRRGHHWKAIAAYDEAIQLDPSYVNAYFYRGWAYGTLRKKQKALADYDRAIQLDPNNAYAVYERRAGVYFQLQEYEKVLADYNQAIQLDPNNASAYAGRAGVYFDLQEYEKALTDYDQAMRVDPSSGYAKAAKSNRELLEWEIREKQKPTVTSASNLFDVGDSDFETKVLKSNVPVIVLFSMRTIFTLRDLMPIYERLSDEYKGKLAFARLDHRGLHEQIRSRYRIHQLPTLMVFKRGKEIGRIVDSEPSRLKANIDRILAQNN